MILTVFLYITAISLIFLGVEIVLWKKKIKLIEKIKIEHARSVLHRMTGKYKNLSGGIMLGLGLIIYLIAFFNSRSLMGI
jgi:hypothetical protein